VGRVSSRITGGSGNPGSLPKTAAELAKTKRGRLPEALRASSNARQVSRFDRRPRSKSSSHSAETAAAKWKTTSNCSLTKAGHWSMRGPTTERTRELRTRSVTGRAKSASTISSGVRPRSCFCCNKARANSVPTNPAPPVIRIFMVSTFRGVTCAAKLGVQLILPADCRLAWHSRIAQV
jgi:hypothetical protein